MSPARALPRWVRGILAALTLILCAQLALAVCFEGRALSRLGAEWRRFDVTRQEATPEDLPGEVYRAMMTLEDKIPQDANVLLLSDVLVPLSFEFYLVPRRVSFLLRFDVEPDRIRGSRTLGPWESWALEERYHFLERSGMRFTEERWREKLPEADHVITYRLREERVLNAPWRRIAQYADVAALWRRSGPGEER